MTIGMRVSAALLAGLLASCAAQPSGTGDEMAATAAAPASPEISLANSRAVARKYIANGTVANMVVGVALRDGREVWMNEGTLAFDNQVPADRESIYRIYSMTKPLTGVAAAILIDEGKLRLDQPVCEIFESFCGLKVLDDPATFGASHPAENPVTIRELMTHTSGLGYNIIPTALAKPYADAGIMPGIRRDSPVFQGGEQPQSLEAFADLVGTMPLRVEPGTDWSYSIGLDVLGAVIQKVSGMPFEQFLKTRIFDPVGMPDTSFVVPQSKANRLTDNYMIMNGKAVAVDKAAGSEYLEKGPFPSGGGGLASTGEDYLRFMEAMANGGRLDGKQAIKKSVVDLATSNLMPEGVCFSAFMAEGQCQGFGAGGRVALDASGGEPVGTYGWGGAASTLAAAMPNEDIAYVMMTQLLFNQTPMQEEFMQALAKDLAPLMAK